MPAQPTVFVFDAYGTLFDVHAAVRRHAAALGPDADRLSQIWRQKQLEYSWTLALMGRYRDFWSLTEAALDTAFALVPSADPGFRDQLLSAYERLDAFPEVPALIRQLRSEGRQLAILSNGTERMLGMAVATAGLTGCFDAVISVDPLRTYKTDPRTYDTVITRFRVYPEAVSFQSSNRWDVAGASAFGFRAVWINRAGAPEEYREQPPVAVLPSLAGVADL